MNLAELLVQGNHLPGMRWLVPIVLAIFLLCDSLLVNEILSRTSIAGILPTLLLPRVRHTICGREQDGQIH